MMSFALPGVAAFRALKCETVAVSAFDEGTCAADILAAWHIFHSEDKLERDEKNLDKQKIHFRKC